MKTHLMTFTVWLVFTAVFFYLFQHRAASGWFGIIVTGYLAAINLAGLLAMMMDKKKAMNGARRIPEKRLFRIAAMGGGIGTAVGMKLFRHKTRHRRFVILLPLMTITQYLVTLL